MKKKKKIIRFLNLFSVFAIAFIIGFSGYDSFNNEVNAVDLEYTTYENMSVDTFYVTRTEIKYSYNINNPIVGSSDTTELTTRFRISNFMTVLYDVNYFSSTNYTINIKQITVKASYEFFTVNFSMPSGETARNVHDFNYTLFNGNLSFNNNNFDRFKFCTYYDKSIDDRNLIFMPLLYDSVDDTFIYNNAYRVYDDYPLHDALVTGFGGVLTSAFISTYDDYYLSSDITPISARIFDYGNPKLSNNYISISGDIVFSKDLDGFYLTSVLNDNILNNITTNNFNDGFNAGTEYGKEIGFSDGYSAGFNAGFNDGINTDTTVSTIFNGIVSIAFVPINFFLAILNFEILGINIAAFVTSILTVFCVIILMKYLRGGGE